ncbi:GNAT family N-acetyltransferase [Thioalkalivibrio denitrificans]|uniref:GNAT family N-acetyltransferase n=1 Tax=Thioalkalivibrio denitrificans TaxID=108003 RepID=A0A1V3NUS4_9GAMM|nr:N-acetyltransferase [Thioalkalivibrio denitrificans]OOG28724.1 GNAT family N-acetyltransferase [Thioalkalivibrio denitrificans]
MQLITTSSADLPDILHIQRAAFGGDVEAGLVRDLLNDPTAQPLLSLLARDDDRAVGHVLFTAARLDAAPRDVSMAILAPLAVVPQAQGQGIGGRLIAHGFRRLTESGVELVFVLGDPGYYRRHGFEPALAHGLLPPFPVSPTDAWMVHALSPDVLGNVHGTVMCADAMNRPEYWRE